MNSQGLNISSRIVDTKTKYVSKAYVNCKSEIEIFFQNFIKFSNYVPLKTSRVRCPNFYIFIANTVQRKLLIFGALAFPKENIYIKVNFIMYSFKVKIIMGPDFWSKGT